MCIAAIPAISAAVGIAQAAVGFGAAQADYNARAEAWKQNYVNSLAAGRDEHTQLQLRQMQEAEASSQREHLIKVEEAEMRADAIVAAGAQGISGASVDALLGDITRQAARNIVTNRRNYMMTAQQLQVEQRAVVSRIKSRINSMERPVAPNPLAFAVQAAGSGLKAVYA